MRYALSNIPGRRAVEHAHHGAPAALGPRPTAHNAGCDERHHKNTGQVERVITAPPGRKDEMLSRTPNTPASLSRRAQAQRRLRRSAPHRLFCSTNGCTTFLVPDESGQRATCPVCGLQRTLQAPAVAASGRRVH
jgi:hypothetical protein